MLADQAKSRHDTSLSARNDRLYFVDHVRVGLTVLVIIQHLALTYGAAGPWYYHEPATEPVAPMVLTTLILVNQAFFMGLFFLISAYFVPGSFDRQGFSQFLKQKCGRLAVPLLLYCAFLNPIAMLGFWFSGDGSTWPTSLPFWEFYTVSMTPGPLWFVQTLFLFCLLYAVYRQFFSSDTGDTVTGDTVTGDTVVDGSSPGYGAAAVLVVGLATATFLVRIWIPVGLFIPVLDLPSLSHFPQYISLFILGLVAHRRNWFTTIPDSMGRVGFVAAFGATATLLPVALTDSPAFLGGMHWQAFVYALWESVFCLGMSVGLLTLFRQRGRTQGRLGRFLSGNSYAVYVIHAPLIVGLAFALRDVDLLPLLKFALVALIAVPVCYVGAYLVRQLPLARQIL